MVVLAIVAVLATLAAPSFTRLVQSNTVSSVVNIFMADMRCARSESIRRGGAVLFRSDAPEAPSPVGNSDSGDGDAGWVSGWIVFLDTDDDADKQADEPLLRVQSRITGIGVMDRMPASLKQSPADDAKTYNLAMPLTNAVNFTLHRVPVATGSMRRDACGTLTLTLTGARGVLVNNVAGSSTLRDTCWK